MDMIDLMQLKYNITIITKFTNEYEIFKDRINREKDWIFEQSIKSAIEKFEIYERTVEKCNAVHPMPFNKREYEDSELYIFYIDNILPVTEIGVEK